MHVQQDLVLAAVVRQSKEGDKMDKGNIAELFGRGQDCGQIVVEHFASKIGVSKEEANRIAAAFGGGLGVGETCGAVMGAMIVLGLKYGHNGPDDNERKGEMNEKRAEFLALWDEKYGKVRCEELLGNNIGTQEGLTKILDEGLLFSFCPSLVDDAIKMLEELA